MWTTRRIITLAAAPVAALALAGAAVAAGGPAAKHHPRVVTSFSQGQFPEGLAIDRQGRRFVSVTTWGATENDPGTGRVVRVTATGVKVPFGPVFQVGFGLLTGVASGPGGLYVAVASNQALDAPGVWKIDTAGQATRVLTLTDASFPNGLAFRGARLFVSDSSIGQIWVVDAAGKASVWRKSRLLTPRGGKGFGANGIAFRGGALFVAVTDRGSIVRIPVRKDGSSGKPVVVAHGELLKGADGIAFGPGGRLYVATSSANTLLRLSLRGGLERLAGPKDGLLYPTTPAFGAGGRAGTLDLVNGDYNAQGTPSLMEVR